MFLTGCPLDMFFLPVAFCLSTFVGSQCRISIIFTNFHQNQNNEHHSVILVLLTRTHAALRMQFIFNVLLFYVIPVSKTIFRKPRRYTSFPEQPNNIPDATATYVGPEGGGHETNVYSHDMYNTEHPNYSSSKFMFLYFIDLGV